MEGREFKDAIFEQFARAATAFGSPKRVEIVDLLSQGERTVESIAQLTGMEVANTSRHLQILKSAGMLSARRDGFHIFYRIADDSVAAGYLALRSLAESRISEVRTLAEAFFHRIDGTKAVDVKELIELSEAGEVVVVDVRPQLEFEAGHLSGAINIPLDQLPERIPDLNQNASVVAYCRGPYCVLAAQAVALFRAAGFQAERLSQGPLEWKLAGIPITRGATWELPQRKQVQKYKTKVKGKVK